MTNSARFQVAVSCARLAGTRGIEAYGLNIALSACGALLLQSTSIAADYKAANTRGKQVQLMTTVGQTIKMRENYVVHDARVAPDGMTAAWLLQDVVTDESTNERGASTLVVYRAGKRRTLSCGQLIREYWFYQQGQQIAYDCGGRHFAGNEVLFDTRTLKELARFHQAEVPTEKRPSWSSSAGAAPEK